MKNILIMMVVVLGAYWVWSIGTEIRADEIVQNESTSAVISVKVVDESSNEILDASVSVRAENGDYALTVSKADDNGRYIFRVNPNTLYYVVATTKGKVASQALSLQPSQVLLVKLMPLER